MKVFFNGQTFLHLFIWREWNADNADATQSRMTADLLPPENSLGDAQCSKYNRLLNPIIPFYI